MTITDTSFHDETWANHPAALEVAAVADPEAVQIIGRRPGTRDYFPRSAPLPVIDPDLDEVIAAVLAVIIRSTGQWSLVSRRVRQGISDMYVHHVPQDARWGDLVEHVRGCQAVLSLSAEQLEELRPSSSPGAPTLHLEIASSQEDLRGWADLGLTVGDGALRIVGNGQVYDDRDMTSLARQVAHLLTCSIDGPLSAVRLLSGDDWNEVMSGWNQTDSDCPEEQVHEAVARLALEHPDRVAVHSANGTETTYSELQDIVRGLSMRMASAGAGRHCPVALLLPRSVEAVAVHLAAFWNAAPVVLLDPDHPSDRIRFALEDSGAVAVATTGGQAEALELDSLVTIIDVEACCGQQHGQDHDPVRPGRDDVAHIAYTSGSSGVPKAVQLKFGPMRQLMHTLIRQCGIGAESRGTWLSAPSLGMVEVDLFPLLGAGATVVLCDADTAVDPGKLQNFIEDNQVSHMLAITSMAEILWARPWPHDTHLQTMRIAGERCRSWPRPDLPFTVLNVYGSSEATVVATADLTSLARDLGEDRERRDPPVGRPVDNVRMYVLGDDGQPTPPGVVGHLHVSGASLSKGYLEREGVTNSVFEENTIPGDPHPVLYRTGDLARYWHDGHIEVTGRSDDMVKIRGYRVSLGEIEACLLTHPGVSQCAVQVVETGGIPQLVGHVEASGDGLEIAQLRDHLAARLPAVMIPAHFLTGDLPRVNGKIDRKSLPQPTGQRPLDVPYTPPSGDREELLAGLWEEFLEVRPIGAEDNFFECGGDSLRGVRMLAILADRHGWTLSISDLLAHPSPREAAPLMEPVTSNNLPVAVPDPWNQMKPFPLNESQQALWLGRGAAVELGNVGCHGYFEWDNSDLDHGRFTRAWVRLVDRHAMLRTIILADGTQRTIPEVCATDIAVDDLRSLSEQEAQERIDSLRERMSHQVIDASTWPLYELRITRMPNGHSRIHLSLDMLIVDAWSLYQALIPDLIELYENPDRELAPLDIGFRDYVLAREAIRETEMYSSARTYWMDRLDTLPAAPALPRSASRQIEHRFDRFETDLDQDTWTQLKDFGRRNEVTSSGIVVTAFAEVLRAWSGDENFTINFPVSDRLPLHPQVDSLVGDFTNTLLVAVTKSDGTLLERAQSIQAQIWEDLDHRVFTGVEVLREIARREGGALRPAMPIVLTSLLGHPGQRSSSDLGDECYGVSQTPQVLLDVQLREIDGVLHIKWDHLPDAFPEGMIADMFAAFCSLLERMKDETTWDQDVFDMRPQYQVEQRREINSTEAPVPQTRLDKLFVQRVQESGSHPAVVTEDGTWTWEQLGAAAEQVARRIEESVHSSSDPIAVLVPKGWLQYASVYGTLLAGKTYLPLDPSQPDQRLARIIARAGAAAVVTTSQDVARGHRLGDIPVIEATDNVEVRDSPVVRATDGPEQTAYIIFTSGSTGEPKGVAVAHRSVINHVQDATRRFGLDETDRHMATAGIHFDMSVFDLFAPLIHGGSVAIPASGSGPDPARWLELAQRSECTFWTAVPALMEMVCMIAEKRSATMPRLRNVVLAGDWIGLDLPDRITRMAPHSVLTSCGGPTETTNWSIAHTVEQVAADAASIPYGRPMANAKYHIVDSHLRHRPTWAVGEMAVEGEIVLAQGYWRDPDRTAERFVTDPQTGARWYLTGDLGRYLPDGSIEILGRNDHQVKINGHRIEIGEVEHAASQLPDVNTAVVVATAPGAHRHLVAWIYPEIAADLDQATVLAELRKTLPGYMVPRDIRITPQLPLTGNGKVDRKRLIELSEQPMEEGLGEDAPISPLAAVVLECAEIIVGKPVLHIETNFFTAGGDSLSAMQFAGLLSDALNCQVEIGEVLQTDTLRDLVTQIETDPLRSTAATAAAQRLAEAA